MVSVQTKILSLILALSALLMLSACESSPNADSIEQPPLDTVDTYSVDKDAKELFEKAVQEIIMLATEDPLTNLMGILGDDIEVIYEERSIGGSIYYETTAAYEDLQSYYSEIFTGDALDWILSTKFADVDGILYCSPIGGATGWSLENLQVEKTVQNNGQYTYKAIFNKVEGSKEPEEATTSQFTIEKMGNGYRISNIDYIPNLLEKN